MASEELEELLKDVKETPINKNTESQNIRSFFQGLSFGFADEIEAAIQSAVVRVTNLNDEQCDSDNSCYYPGYYVPRTFSFGFRYQY